MKTWVVTGADRGIGAAICAEVAGRGDHAIAACLAAEARHHHIETVAGIDVSSDTSVARLRQHLSGRRVDVLVHNAGVIHERDLGQLDYGAMMREYAVNALGPLRVSEALLDCLESGSKIGVISSRVGSLSENGSGGLWGYRMSKAAANMASLNLAHALRDRGISVMALHPGSVRTEMTAGLVDLATVGNLLSPQQAAAGLVARLDALDLASSGSFFHANGERLPW